MRSQEAELWASAPWPGPRSCSPFSLSAQVLPPSPACFSAQEDPELGPPKP